MDISPDTTSTDTEPRTKESSVLDFTYLSLAELEEGVMRIFRNNEYCPECDLHQELLGALPFRMLSHGWKKEELLEFFSNELDDAIENIAEWDKEDEEKVA